MNREVFEKRYASRLSLCVNFNSIRPVSAFIHELAICVVDTGQKCFDYIQTIEEDLYSKRIIPFKIGGIDALQKIEKVIDRDTRQLLWYIWLAWINLEKYKEK